MSNEIEQIKEVLKDRNLKAVALGADISAGSLYKLMDGSTTKPSWELISKLKKYLGID